MNDAMSDDSTELPMPMQKEEVQGTQKESVEIPAVGSILKFKLCFFLKKKFCFLRS